MSVLGVHSWMMSSVWTLQSSMERRSEERFVKASTVDRTATITITKASWIDSISENKCCQSTTLLCQVACHCWRRRFRPRWLNIQIDITMFKNPFNDIAHDTRLVSMVKSYLPIVASRECQPFDDDNSKQLLSTLLTTQPWTWYNWNMYLHDFIDFCHVRFDGGWQKEIKKASVNVVPGLVN